MNIAGHIPKELEKYIEPLKERFHLKNNSQLIKVAIQYLIERNYSNGVLPTNNK